jgi:DNA-directed RNA polymerase subunit K/omega
MDYKKTNASNTTITRNFNDLEKDTGNIYETIVIISKRSRQIQKDLKEELNKKLKDFASYTDNLEEIFENREQIEISKFYERLPKPELIATQEYLEGKLFYKKPEIEE